MGGSQSTGSMELGPDKIDLPHWAKSSSNEGARPIVFFDIEVDKKPLGRIEMTLMKDVVPLTVDNFFKLCTGELGIGRAGKPLHYKGKINNNIARGFKVNSFLKEL